MSLQAIVVRKKQRPVQPVVPKSPQALKAGWRSAGFGMPLKDPVEGETRVPRMWSVIGKSIKAAATGTGNYFRNAAGVLTDNGPDILDLTGETPSTFKTGQRRKGAQF